MNPFLLAAYQFAFKPIEKNQSLLLFILSFAVSLCWCYKPVLNGGKPAYKLTDRFCKSGPSPGRTLCHPSYYYVDQRPKKHTKLGTWEEAKAFCDNYTHGYLPRPTTADELDFIATRVISRVRFYLDGWDDLTSTYNFRRGDGSIVKVDDLENVDWDYDKQSYGSCLTVKGAPNYQIQPFNCFTRTYFTCEWCVPHEKKMGVGDCYYFCICRDGTFRCGYKNCKAHEYCLPLKSSPNHFCHLLPCRYNRFGDGCKFQCHCDHYQPCDPVTGDCSPHGCLPGWMGRACNLTKCKSRRGGQNCDKICYCGQKQFCELSTAYCHVNCEPGILGFQCNQTVCPIGWFGKDCKKNCTCPPHQPCHPDHGACVDDYCDTVDGSCFIRPEEDGDKEFRTNNGTNNNRTNHWFWGDDESDLIRPYMIPYFGVPLSATLSYIFVMCLLVLAVFGMSVVTAVCIARRVVGDVEIDASEIGTSIQSYEPSAFTEEPSAFTEEPSTLKEEPSTFKEEPSAFTEDTLAAESSIGSSLLKSLR